MQGGEILVFPESDLLVPRDQRLHGLLGTDEEVGSEDLPFRPKQPKKTVWKKCGTTCLRDKDVVSNAKGDSL
uniref:Uncharacterized protein n=1 Tax=Steinernema glaseri TaxID=37863 RepID=A0A1I8ANX9_9BILA